METVVLRDNYAHLRDTIQAPEDVANRLFSRGTIDSHTKFNSTHLQLVRNVKNCSKLLNTESPQTQEYFMSWLKFFVKNQRQRNWVTSYCVMSEVS